MSDEPRPPLSLLFRLYLANQAARQFMRLSLAGTGLSGEEYAVFSYFFANGPRTMTQAAADLGYPLTTMASILSPSIETGDLVRRSHPTDRRARLVELTETGRERLRAAIPAFSAAHRAVLSQLEDRGADPTALATAIDEVREAIARTNELLAAEGAGSISEGRATDEPG